ncbi:MAG: signal peptidase I [Burkholderiaceae bacterium]|nr:signal peptidase I [Burkholderiaceae bacterium]
MNFALIVFLLCVFTGLLWIADRLVWRKRRAPDAPRPLWLEYTAGFFPVIFVVFILRSFLVEPFSIPSGSMIPTLRVGDLILVNKYSYGVRLPIIHTKIVSTGEPQRGDVAVFRYPEDESVDYIKRVIGVPGDVIRYEQKRLYVNDQPVSVRPLDPFFDSGRISLQFQEQHGGRTYRILNDDNPMAMGFIPQSGPRGCQATDRGLRCEVPKGHYFMMGDNRDNSSDSRVWGFVPERNLVGRAFFIWFNAGEVMGGKFDRLGNFE